MAYPMLPSDDNKVDENDIFSILKHHNKFNTFYEKEWQTRKIPTLWYLVPDLKDYGKAHDYIERGVRTLYIEFNHCPSIKNIEWDSYIFAHEMGHIIRFYEGKNLKILAFDNPELNGFPISVKEALIGMIEDVAVDRLLYDNYDFNLLPHYEEAINTSKISLRNIKTEPSGLDRKYLLLQLIKECFRWEIIQNRESNRIWTNYESCLRSRYDSLITQRDAVLSQISGLSLNTPEEQNAVFDIIVNECELNDVVFTVFGTSKRMKEAIRKQCNTL